VFIQCTDSFAIMSATRCGHTNMFNYFDLKPWTDTGFTLRDWSEHHNPIVVLRNPLERLLSAKAESNRWIHNIPVFISHSRPYMNMLLSCNFRIIDFYDLEQYIPRKDVPSQSFRSDSRVDNDTTVQDVYVENSVYTIQELQQEVDTYKKLMVTKERVSVEEWNKLNAERFLDNL
jgi:hypothetical protein